MGTPLNMLLACLKHTVSPIVASAMTRQIPKSMKLLRGRLYTQSANLLCGTDRSSPLWCMRKLKRCRTSFLNACKVFTSPLAPGEFKGHVYCSHAWACASPCLLPQLLACLSIRVSATFCLMQQQDCAKHTAGS